MLKKFAAFMLMVMMTVSLVPTAFAADTSPYVYNWKDDVTGLQHVQYYEQDVVNGTINISDRVSLKGNTLYDMAGITIATDVKEWSDAQPTVGINDTGLFFISKDGELRFMKHSTDQTYATSTFSAAYLELDVESKALSARNGRVSSALKDLTFTGSNKRKDDPSVTKGAYVKSTAVEGDPEKIAYLAYANDKLFLTTYCRASNVWQQDFKKLLSSTCKGAKFCGYTSNYSIYLYNISGTVYEFKYSDGYTTAYTVLTGETVYMFERNSAGFISKIVTNKGSHDVGTVVTVPTTPPANPGNPGNGTPSNPTPGASVTSVRNFLTKSMAYNGAALVGTLVKDSNGLSWQGTALANSSGTNDFGVSASGVPFWVLSGKAYAYQNGASNVVADGVAQLVFDNDGRVSAIKTTGNKTIEI